MKIRTRIAAVVVSAVAIISAGTMNIAAAGSCEVDCTVVVPAERGERTAPIVEAPAASEDKPAPVVLPTLEEREPVAKKAPKVVAPRAPAAVAVEVVEEEEPVVKVQCG